MLSFLYVGIGWMKGFLLPFIVVLIGLISAVLGFSQLNDDGLYELFILVFFAGLIIIFGGVSMIYEKINFGGK